MPKLHKIRAFKLLLKEVSLEEKPKVIRFINQLESLANSKKRTKEQLVHDICAWKEELGINNHLFCECLNVYKRRLENPQFEHTAKTFKLALDAVLMEEEQIWAREFLAIEKHLTTSLSQSFKFFLRDSWINIAKVPSSTKQLIQSISPQAVLETAKRVPGNVVQLSYMAVANCWDFARNNPKITMQMIFVLFLLSMPQPVDTRKIKTRAPKPSTSPSVSSAAEDLQQLIPMVEANPELLTEPLAANGLRFGHLVAQAGRIPQLEYGLKKIPRKIFMLPDDEGHDPVDHACKADQDLALEVLMKAGLLKINLNKEGAKSHCIYLAAYAGARKVLEKLRPYIDAPIPGLGLPTTAACLELISKATNAEERAKALSAFSILFEYGADPNYQNPVTKQSLVEVVFSLKWTEGLEVLLATKKLNFKNPLTRVTLLEFAFEQDWNQGLEILLTKGVTFEGFSEHRVFTAIKKSNLAKVKTLVKHGWGGHYLNDKARGIKESARAIYELAQIPFQQEVKEILQFFVAQGLDINNKDWQDYLAASAPNFEKNVGVYISVLMRAIVDGNEGFIQAWLDVGGKVESYDVNAAQAMNLSPDLIARLQSLAPPTETTSSSNILSWIVGIGAAVGGIALFYLSGSKKRAQKARELYLKIQAEKLVEIFREVVTIECPKPDATDNSIVITLINSDRADVAINLDGERIVVPKNKLLECLRDGLKKPLLESAYCGGVRLEEKSQNIVIQRVANKTLPKIPMSSMKAELRRIGREVWLAAGAKSIERNFEYLTAVKVIPQDIESGSLAFTFAERNDQNTITVTVDNESFAVPEHKLLGYIQGDLRKSLAQACERVELEEKRGNIIIQNISQKSLPRVLLDNTIAQLRELRRQEWQAALDIYQKKIAEAFAPVIKLKVELDVATRSLIISLDGEDIDFENTEINIDGNKIRVSKTKFLEQLRNNLNQFLGEKVLLNEGGREVHITRLANIAPPVISCEKLLQYYRDRIAKDKEKKLQREKKKAEQQQKIERSDPSKSTLVSIYYRQGLKEKEELEQQEARRLREQMAAEREEKERESLSARSAQPASSPQDGKDETKAAPKGEVPKKEAPKKSDPKPRKYIRVKRNLKYLKTVSNEDLLASVLEHFNAIDRLKSQKCTSAEAKLSRYCELLYHVGRFCLFWAAYKERQMLCENFGAEKAVAEKDEIVNLILLKAAVVHRGKLAEEKSLLATADLISNKIPQELYNLKKISGVRLTSLPLLSEEQQTDLLKRFPVNVLEVPLNIKRTPLYEQLAHNFTDPDRVAKKVITDFAHYCHEIFTKLIPRINALPDKKPPLDVVMLLIMCGEWDRSFVEEAFRTQTKYPPAMKDFLIHCKDLRDNASHGAHDRVEIAELRAMARNINPVVFDFKESDQAEAKSQQATVLPGASGQNWGPGMRPASPSKIVELTDVSAILTATAKVSIADPSP